LCGYKLRHDVRHEDITAVTKLIFRGYRKVANTDHSHRHVYLSFCQAPNGRIFKKFGTRVFFENLLTEFKFH